MKKIVKKIVAVAMALTLAGAGTAGLSNDTQKVGAYSHEHYIVYVGLRSLLGHTYAYSKCTKCSYEQGILIR